MDNQENFERLAHSNAFKKETKSILEEIPFLIEYLDQIYPPQDEEFEKRLVEFEERLEAIDNV